MFSHAFEIFIPSLTISFHEVTARISLIAATNGSFTSRKISIALCIFYHIFSENESMRFNKSSHQYRIFRGKKL